jgi:hypothetical protein
MHLQRATLAPIHLANDAGASTATQSGEMQGKASPPYSAPPPPLRERVPWFPFFGRIVHHFEYSFVRSILDVLEVIFEGIYCLHD